MTVEGAPPGIVQVDAPVISNAEVIAQHNLLVCNAPEIASLARPGHFVNASANGSIPGAQERKPFSIFQADPDAGTISLLYQVHASGTTTSGMVAKRPGDVLDIIGPLGGNVFEADAAMPATHIMVGGGYGVPPLVFLAQRIRDARPDCSVRFVLGARSKELLLCEEHIAGLNIPPDVATEDGSHGRQGRVTDILQEIIAGHGPDSELPARVYTCGPSAMMRAVAEMCIEAGVECQVSLGIPMPCGIGTCGECVITLSDARQVRACLSGPVFDAAAVVWKS